MKLAKFGILVKKTTYLFQSIRDSNISWECAKILEIPEGSGGKLWGQFRKIHRGGGSYGKSLPWGWGGYFLEPHISDLLVHFVLLGLKLFNLNSTIITKCYFNKVGVALETNV